MTRTAVIVACVLAPAGLQQGPPPTFGASSDAVTVDVAVFNGHGVVRGLRIDDFELRDNGVRQTLTAADYNVLPIDLRLVFDISGSISEEHLARYERTMQEVAATLQRDDRCEIITFNTRIADAAARQHPPVTIKVRRQGEDGTAFFDAVSLAMVTIRVPDRRQVTIVLSDAKDNASFFDEDTMLDVARLTDAVVYTILPEDPKQSRAVSKNRLQAVALLTGGQFVETHEANVGNAVINALREFRFSYRLFYTPAGVPMAGWHKLDIRVRDGEGYRLRAKDGYFSRRAP